MEEKGARKYNPGDLVIVRMKVVAVTEKENGEIKYDVKAISAGAYSSVTVEDADITGHLKAEVRE